MEFHPLQKELNRRKIAYCNLVISLTCGIFLSTLIFHYSASPIIYIFLAAAFLLLGITAFRATNQLSKMLLIIERDEIKRITEKETEIFLISNIVKIVAKKRSAGGIREITFVFHNGKTLIINAFEGNFEEILKIVTSKLNPEFAIKYTHEPIDYDYPAFYSVLGLLLGFIFAFCFDYTTKINYQSFEFISYLISIYLFSLGAYFLVKKTANRKLRTFTEEKRHFDRISNDHFRNFNFINKNVYLKILYLN